MRIRPLRITSVRAKTAYVLFSLIVALSISIAGIRVGVDPLGIVVLRSIADTAAIYFGTRIFRSVGEPILPRRPWWRATGRPTAGFVIALLLAASLIYALAGTITDLSPAGVSSSALIVFTTVVYIAFYLNSSLRLRRARVSSSHDLSEETGTRRN